MARPTTESVVAQIDEIITRFDAAVRLELDGFRPDVDDEIQRMLLTRCQAAVERAAPAGSVYRRMAAEVVASHNPVKWQLAQLIGIARALRDDYAGGYMAAVEDLVQASLFDDFLAMAEELLQKDYKDPAAVIGGSVLEEHLRKLADRRGLATARPDGQPVPTSRLNDELRSAGVYNLLEQKSVASWLELRNKAAHGQYGEYEATHVDMLLQNIRSFVARNPV